MIRTGSFWKNASPSGALSDFATVFRHAGRGRWWVLAAAAATTALVFAPIMNEEARVLPKPPTIIYITTFRPDRTDAEIRAENLANQRLQDRLNARQAAQDALGRSMYKAMGRASGLDVDAMERQARIDAVAAARAQAAQQARLYGAWRATPSPTPHP